MSNVFNKYADYYDIIYRNKDYSGECDYIENLVSPYFKNTPKESIKILDVACGTGNHTNILAKRGYQVVGSDLSSQMIEIAKKKASKEGLAVNYHGSTPMQHIDFGIQFDVIICMFAAIDYLTEKADIIRFFKKAHQHLKQGGLLLFDFYNGIESLKNYDSCRIKEFIEGNKKLIRISRTNCDYLRNRLEIEFEVICLEDDILVFRDKELHKMRYHLPLDMQDFVQEASFEILKLCPFQKPMQKITGTDWNISLLAQKHSDY